jgi:hypothetical protein
LKDTLVKILKYSVFLGAGAFLFYLAFKNTEFSKLVEDFQKARYEFVVASMIMGYLAFISRGMRWVILLEPLGKKPRVWNAVHAVAIGYLTNLLIPRAGELARCTALQQTDKIPVNRLFGTVILERVIDLIMLILLVVLTLILEFNQLNSFFDTAFSNNTSEADGSSGTILKIAIVAVGALGILALYLLRQKFQHMPIYAKIRDFWEGIKEGLKSIGKLENKWPFILHTLFIWAMYYLMVYICVFALPATENLNPSSGLFVMIVAGLGMVVPTPGGIGAYHYLVMLALGVLGVSATDGVSFATLVHTGQLVMTVIGGLIAVAAMARVRARNKKAEALQATEENA